MNNQLEYMAKAELIRLKKEKIKEMQKNANCYIQEYDNQHYLDTNDFESFESFAKYSKFIVSEKHKKGLSFDTFAEASVYLNEELRKNLSPEDRDESVLRFSDSFATDYQVELFQRIDVEVICADDDSTITIYSCMLNDYNVFSDESKDEILDYFLQIDYEKGKGIDYCFDFSVSDYSPVNEISLYFQKLKVDFFGADEWDGDSEKVILLNKAENGERIIEYYVPNDFEIVITKDWLRKFFETRKSLSMRAISIESGLAESTIKNILSENNRTITDNVAQTIFPVLLKYGANVKDILKFSL